MTIVRHRSPAETLITVDGAFDPDAASRLHDLVREVGTDTPLTLDFREVRLFHDCALAALADALSSHPGARLVGLSQHHFRLLHYLTEARAETTSAA